MSIDKNRLELKIENIRDDGRWVKISWVHYDNNGKKQVIDSSYCGSRRLVFFTNLEITSDKLFTLKGKSYYAKVFQDEFDKTLVEPESLVSVSSTTNSNPITELTNTFNTIKSNKVIKSGPIGKTKIIVVKDPDKVKAGQKGSDTIKLWHLLEETREVSDNSHLQTLRPKAYKLLQKFIADIHNVI